MEYRRVNALVRMADVEQATDVTMNRLMTVLGEAGPQAQIRWTIRTPRRDTLALDLAATGIPATDLDWIFTDVYRTDRRRPAPTPTAGQVSELLPASIDTPAPDADSTDHPAAQQASPILGSGLPVHRPWTSTLVEAMLACPGVAIRTYLAPLPRQTVGGVRARVAAASGWAPDQVAAFVGTPLAARTLVLAPQELPLRIKGMLRHASPDLDLHHLGDLGDPTVRAQWEGDLAGLAGLPDRVVRSLLFLPIAGAEPVPGIACLTTPPRDIALPEPLPRPTRPLRLGSCTVAGIGRVDALLDASDLTRHLQVVGQTGTGKSTLLAALVAQAAGAGVGLTLIDPHGTTIDRVIAEADEDTAARMRVFRMGDLDHPLPLSPWDPTDPTDVELATAALLDLLREMFDPKHQGILGPRFERWFAMLARAAVALLGQRASLLAMTFLGRDQDTTRKAARALANLGHQELADQLNAEFNHLSATDAAELTGWAMSKFERLIGTPHLRAALGTGADAFGFAQAVDQRDIVLIDLAMPTIGTPAARTLGTLALQRLWRAILTRADRTDPHLLFIDEAHLFQHGVLPAMLAEGRKFGLGLTVAHQHHGQLSPDLADALEANSASLIAFRAAINDTPALSARLGGWPHTDLARLPRFHAATTLTTGPATTEAFTLRVDHNQHTGQARPDLVDQITERAHHTSDRYAHLTPITATEVTHRLDELVNRADFLSEFLARRDATRAPAPPQATMAAS